MNLMRKWIVTLLLLLVPSKTWAYPSSAVFTPSGEARPAGSVGALSYASLNMRPAVATGTTWFGVEAGLLPQWSYSSDLKFGGLEIGADAILPKGGPAKPVFNAKLGLVTEGPFSPSLAVGSMELSPILSSMDYIYQSATKTFFFGRLTLGLGEGVGGQTQLRGSLPVDGHRLNLMTAYESPLFFKRIGFAVDYLGGRSEVSDLYVGATMLISDQASIAVGGFRGNDSKDPDGVFGYLSVSFNVLHR